MRTPIPRDRAVAGAHPRLLEMARIKQAAAPGNERRHGGLSSHDVAITAGRPRSAPAGGSRPAGRAAAWRERLDPARERR